MRTTEAAAVLSVHASATASDAERRSSCACIFVVSFPLFCVWIQIHTHRLTLAGSRSFASLLLLLVLVSVSCCRRSSSSGSGHPRRASLTQCADSMYDARDEPRRTLKRAHAKCISDARTLVHVSRLVCVCVFARRSHCVRVSVSLCLGTSACFKSRACM